MGSADDERKLWPGERTVARFECIILSAIQVLLLVLVTVGVLSLFYLMSRAAVEQFGTIDDVPSLQIRLQNAFSGVLLTLIGLELIETVRAYLHSHYVRLEVVIIIALIALGRHIVELNPRELGGLNMIGLGVLVLVLALAIGYYIVRITTGARRRLPRGRGERDHAEEKMVS